jgi:hypothetical protein
VNNCNQEYWDKFYIAQSEVDAWHRKWVGSKDEKRYQKRRMRAARKWRRKTLRNLKKNDS